MADFKPALQRMLKNEGPYSNNPLDKGGETVWGIARNFHPDWKGWAIVDSLRDRPDFPRCLDSAVSPLVEEFYKGEYWPVLYDQIPNQYLAEKLFDAGVNLGLARATMLLQRAAKVNPDGVLGPKTLQALSLQDCTQLMKEFMAQWAVYYAKIVAKDPSQLVFVLGWMRRVVD